MQSKNSVCIQTPSNQLLQIGGTAPLLVIAGPCVIESREMVLEHADAIQLIAQRVGLQLIFKASFDKANRTSKSGYRGVGVEEGLRILDEVRVNCGLCVISDIHESWQAAEVAKVCDVLQIPAFLCRQTDLLTAAGETGKPVMIKKGQMVAPEDMQYAAEKVASGGCQDVMLCERGVMFGYRELVVDFRSLGTMRKLGFPVVFDATHSVQIMGGAGGASSGRREFVSDLARAAVAVGVDGIFLEAHKNPGHAPSDGANMLALDQLESLLRDLKRLDELALETRCQSN